MRSFFFATLALAASSVKAGMDAWHADYMITLANEQLDPIVNPNGQATHMHTIVGGSAMSAAYDQNTYENAKCSTIYNQADKSNYWVPQLYWYDPALGSKPYIPIRSSMRFYYFLGRNSPAQPVQTFPKGLRILAGDMNMRSPTFKVAYICQTSRTLTGGVVGSGFNFDRNCPNGLKSVLYFPQCWDGLNLWLPNSAHMSYPSDPGNFRAGACPLSHPVRLPYIQLEIGWYPEEIAPGQALNGKLTWAQGDATGYGLHGDFVNGWDTDILTAALNHPGCLTGDEQAMETCPVFIPHWNEGAALSCKPERGILQEPFGNAQMVAIPSLPGRNAPPGAPMPNNAPLNVGPFMGTDGAYQVPASEAQNFVWPTAPGWKSIGCLRNMQSVTNMTSINDPGLSPERCQSVCGAQGQAFAGVGMRYGTNAPTCVCGSAIADSASVYPLMCNTTCPGNSSATCGGADAWEFYFAPPGTSLNAGSGSSLGCLTNSGAGLREQATYSFTSQTLTTAICKQACVDRNATWAMTSNGQNCYCGTNYNIGKDTYVPLDQCTTPCMGNKSETCGFTYRSNVYNMTRSSFKPQDNNKPAGWQGCYTKPSNGQALSNSTWTSTSMTTASCVNGCAGLGAKYAALTNGNTCQCGDTTNLGANLPASQCTSPCAGNSTETCGGSIQVEVFTTSASTVTPAAVSSKYPTGWTGCYVHQGSNMALTNYSYTSASMTVDMCKNACTGFGYPFAGMNNAQGCSCGSVAPKTTKVSADNCNMACKGNATQFCGASAYMDVYTTGGSGAIAAPGGSNAYQGCFQNYGGGGLPSYTWRHNAMTTEMCRTGCASLNYTMAGTENANQCRCGNKWLGGAILPDSSCSSPCTGNSTQKCGAPSISSVWLTAGAPPTAPRAAGWTGCFTDPGSARVLPAYMFRGSMTVDICRTSCSQKGYKLSGLENGNECWCDNALVNAAPAPATICNTACSAASSTLCGGPGVIDVYSSVVSAGNGTSGSASLGCFTDWGTTNSYNFNSDLMTQEMCSQVCIVKGYKFSAIRNGNLCQCGDTAPRTLTTAATCSSKCAGNTQQSCGASAAVNAFDLSKVADRSGNIIAPTDSKGFIGCFVNKLGPVLDVNLLSSASMTNALCARSCQEVGYPLSGTYSSKTCYCGRTLNATTTNYMVSAGQCNSVCTGNANEKCGGSYLLSVYDAAKYISANNIAAPPTKEGLKGCYAVGKMISEAKYIQKDAQMSTSWCRRICRNNNFPFAALYDGNTCACANHNLYGAIQPAAACTSACTGNKAETCGSNANVNIYDVSGAGSLPPAGSPANYIGCAASKDTSGNSLLTGYSTSSAAMTPQMCNQLCKNQGQAYYGLGLSSGKACYCGALYPTPQIWYQDSACSWQCQGDSSQKCGNSYAFSLYKDSSVTANARMRIASTPLTDEEIIGNMTANATVSSSVSSALRANATSSVIVNGTASIAANVTSSVSRAANATGSAASASITASGNSSLPFASVNGTNATVSATASRSSASLSASANATSFSLPANGTSASASLRVNATSTSASLTVNVTSTSSASLSASANVTSIRPNATSTSTASLSSASANVTSTVVTSSAALNTSSIASASSSAAISSSVSSAAVSSSSSAPASSTSSSLSPAMSAPSKDPTYLGCYTPPTSTAPADIVWQFTTNSTVMEPTRLTPETCRALCKDKQYKFAGITNGTDCSCTNDIAKLAPAPLLCKVPCVGSIDRSVMCGSDAALTSASSPVGYGVWKVDTSVQVTRRHARDLHKLKLRHKGRFQQY